MLNISKIIDLSKKEYSYNTNFLEDYLPPTDFNDFDDLINWLDDKAGDYIHEAADRMVDIYYYDLRKWAVDNYEWIEEAMKEGFIDTNDFNYHKAIQAGQYLYFEGQILEDLRNFTDFINDTYNF